MRLKFFQQILERTNEFRYKMFRGSIYNNGDDIGSGETICY